MPECLTFKESSRVGLIHGEQDTSCLSIVRENVCERVNMKNLLVFDSALLLCDYLPELGEGELSSPHLTLAAESVSADELEPIIYTS